MQLIRNPFVWLWRIRHRRGYGIHSPWAYAFVRDVILNRSRYYAYSYLDTRHPWYVRYLFRYHIECCRLLFRLSNYADGASLDIYNMSHEYDETEFDYIYSAKEGMDAPDWHDQYVADFTFVKHGYLPHYKLQPCKILVLEGIHRDKTSRRRWEEIKADPRTGCTFDVYTYGIVFFDHNRTKQHYIVNF